MTRYHLLLILTLAATPWPCDAGVAKQTRGAAALEIRWDSTEHNLELADLITVTLTVTIDMTEPRAPLALAGAAKWQLVARSAPALGPTKEGKRTWQLTYRFAPTEPGKLAFAFPPVKYRAANGDEQTATWDPVEFQVKTPIPNELRDITDVEAMPPIPAPDRTVWFAFALGVVGLIGIGSAIVVRRWLRRARVRTSAQRALDACNRLVAAKLHETGRRDRFIVLLNLLVRRFLERDLDLPARRRTTPEFVRQLASSPLLSDEEKLFLTPFFDRCDAVKFAQADMAAEECRQWAEAVTQFLERRAGQTTPDLGSAPK